MRFARTARFAAAGALALTVLAFPPTARAERDGTDRFDYVVRSETSVRWFQRALLPLPSGSLLAVQTVAPVHEYVDLHAAGLDAPWQSDGLDLELSAWQALTLGHLGYERRIDADVTTASVRLRLGQSALELGRQTTIGGAARLTRLDGVSLRLRDDALGLDAYGGLVVLPRWTEQPSYHHLGSASDTLLRNAAAFPSASRQGFWAVGGRARYREIGAYELALSLHEEHGYGTLERREAGVDASLSIIPDAHASVHAVLDLDGLELSDARAVLDVEPIEPLLLCIEYLRTVPALFLANQSVLSVFSTDAFQEAGVDASLAVYPELTLGGYGYVQLLDEGALGHRLGTRARSRVGRLLTQLGYQRVSEIDNGYHSLRLSLRYGLPLAASVTAEQYAYFYDAPIRNHRVSLVHATSLGWQPTRELELTVAGSLIQSPHAVADARALARLTLSIDRIAGGAR
jgi:hypothetical protein